MEKCSTKKGPSRKNCTKRQRQRAEVWRWEITGCEEERESSVPKRDLSEPEGAGGGPESPAECTSKGGHLTQNQQATSEIVCTGMMT